MEIDYTKLKRDYKLDPLKRGEIPEKEDLVYLYLELNLSVGEVENVFGGAKRGNVWIKYYGIVKDRKQVAACSKRRWEEQGLDCPARRTSVKEKKKETCLRKYGTEYAINSTVVREKSRQTMMENFGVECAFLSAEVQQKINETNLKRYGTKFPSQNPEIHAKSVETYNNRSEEEKQKTEEKRFATNLQRYGTHVPSQSNTVKEKIKNSHKERTAEQIEEANRKRKQTCMERYGHEVVTQVEEIKLKARNTSLEHFGCEYGMQSQEVKERRRQNNIEKWGSSNISTSHLSSETLKVISDRSHFAEFLSQYKGYNIYELAELLGMSYAGVQKKLHEYDLWDSIDHPISTPERELQKILGEDFLKSRSVIPPYEIDLFSSEHNLGIEFNGDYWHSFKHLQDKCYHQKKTLMARERRIFIYHIFEYEWRDSRKREIILSQINSRLGKNKRVMARKCRVMVVPSNEAKEFLQENHLQGYVNSPVNLGLYFENELVGLMTFGSPRFTSDYQWELLRFCTKQGISVVGGASKLFSYFVRVYSPVNVISYCNLAKGDGLLYEKLGFTFLRITTPNYVWCKGNVILPRYQTQKHLIINCEEDKQKTEVEIMEERGYNQIFDCGNLVFEWIAMD